MDTHVNSEPRVEPDKVEPDLLEKLYALPDADKDTVEETEEQDEWLPACTVVHGHVMGKTKGNRCNKPAEVNVSVLCPFCGPHKLPLCKDDMHFVLDLNLCCLGCSEKAGTYIKYKPVSCLWKPE